MITLEETCVPVTINSNHILGIVLLEEMLILGDAGEERPAKRAKGATGASTAISGDTATWIEMAR